MSYLCDKRGQARCHGYLYQASEREKRVKDHLWEGFLGQAHHSEVYITSVYMPRARAQSQGQTELQGRPGNVV